MDISDERDPAADKQQVQAAMAMAAFYSQRQIWQAAVAAREVSICSK